jgi:hopanoid-associated phosphorylase
MWKKFSPRTSLSWTSLSWSSLSRSALSWSDVFGDTLPQFSFSETDERHQAPEFAAAQNAVVALVGLAFEAKIAAGPGVLTICRGGGPQAAELIQLAVRAGCRSIISFGVAGGLAPDLLPGDCVVASAIIDQATARATDLLWSHNLLEAIPNARHGPIIGVNQVVGDPTSKQKLHKLTGAIAVDMESHLVTRLAAIYGLSFAAVRVVVDPAHRLVPPAAVLAMGPSGSADVTAMLCDLWERPSQLVALLRLAVDVYAARAALIRLRRAVGPCFGWRDFEWRD